MFAPSTSPEVRIRQTAAGGWHCLAVSVKGECFAWGGNEYRQLGIDTDDMDILMATSVLPDLKVAMVAAGGTHSLALTEDGHVWTWGEPWGDFSLEVRPALRPTPAPILTPETRSSQDQQRNPYHSSRPRNE